MKRIVIWVIIVAVLAVAAWLYFRPGQDTAASTPELTRRGVATRGDLTVSISAVGTVQPIHAVEIKSKASGQITKLGAEVGDVVRTGDALVQLDPTKVRNDYDQAKADAEVAKVTLEQRRKDLDRQKGLFDKELISESDYDAARLAYEQANSQYVRAQAALSTSTEQLADTEIRSPLEGLVLSRQVEEGQIIASGVSSYTGGTLLYTIADMSKVYVIADVDETDIGRVQIGLPARVVADAYPEREFDGGVLRVAPLAKVEQNVTMFEVTVLVDNKDGFLKAGMNANVEMVIDQTTDAVLVPVRAVQTRTARPDSMAAHAAMARMSDSGGPRRGGPPSGGRPGGRMGHFVQVIENGQIVDRRVRVGLTNLDFVQILEGVQPGDSIVWQLTSGALASREEFRQRMLSRSSVPGMQRSR